MAKLSIKRVYDDPAPADGLRVLVDRLWPRGMTKDALAAEVWAKDLAPSRGLRVWFGHDPARLGDFATAYTEELTERWNTEAMDAAALRVCEAVSAGERVTLLYAAKDPACNHAAVLAAWLRG